MEPLRRRIHQERAQDLRAATLRAATLRSALRRSVETERFGATARENPEKFPAPCFRFGGSVLLQRRESCTQEMAAEYTTPNRDRMESLEHCTRSARLANQMRGPTEAVGDPVKEPSLRNRAEFASIPTAGRDPKTMFHDVPDWSSNSGPVDSSARSSRDFENEPTDFGMTPIRESAMVAPAGPACPAPPVGALAPMNDSKTFVAKAAGDVRGNTIATIQSIRELVRFAAMGRNAQGRLEFRIGFEARILGGIEVRVIALGNRAIKLALRHGRFRAGDRVEENINALVKKLEQSAIKVESIECID